MRIAAILFLFIALTFSVGCGMSGPGIARVQAPPPQGEPQPARVEGIHPDKSWVNPYPQQEAAHKPHMSVDISERKLGERPMSKDLTVDGEGRPLQGAEARQELRRQARMAEWKARMGLQSSKPSADGEKPKAKPAPKAGS